MNKRMRMHMKACTNQEKAGNVDTEKPKYEEHINDKYSGLLWSIFQ